MEYSEGARCHEHSWQSERRFTSMDKWRQTNRLQTSDLETEQPNQS